MYWTILRSLEFSVLGNFRGYNPCAVQRFLDLLQCFCGGPLTEANGIRCKSCDREYPVMDGVLILEPDGRGGLEEELQKQEEVVRDKQVKFYEKWMEFHPPSRIEKRWVQAALNQNPLESAIEVACGPGRWTPILAQKTDRLVALDRSFLSVKRNREKLVAMGLGDKVLHVKGDATALPGATGAFAGVFSGQLLEHLPSPELRSAAVAEMGRVLKPGGRAIISAYEYTSWNPFVGKKEGQHAGGMYYYRFSRAEYRELLAQSMEVEDLRSAMGHILVGFGRGR